MFTVFFRRIRPVTRHSCHSPACRRRVRSTDQSHLAKCFFSKTIPSCMSTAALPACRSRKTAVAAKIPSKIPSTRASRHLAGHARHSHLLQCSPPLSHGRAARWQDVGIGCLHPSHLPPCLCAAHRHVEALWIPNLRRNRWTPCTPSALPQVRKQASHDADAHPNTGFRALVWPRRGPRVVFRRRGLRR